jgi:hypothetical protein
LKPPAKIPKTSEAKERFPLWPSVHYHLADAFGPAKRRRNDLSRTMKATVKEAAANAEISKEKEIAETCPRVARNRRNPPFSTPLRRRAANGPTIAPSLNSSSGTARNRDWLSTELSFCVTGSVSNRGNTRLQQLICASPLCEE